MDELPLSGDDVAALERALATGELNLGLSELGLDLDDVEQARLRFQTREVAILDACLELVRVRGYAATTLDDVRRAIHIAKPTIYRHFRSKDALGTAIAVRLLAQLEEEVARCISGAPRGGAAEALVSAALQLYLDRADFARLVEAMQLLPAAGLEQAEGQLVNALTEALPKGLSRGSELAAIHAFLQVMKSHVHRALHRSGQVSREELGGMLLRVLTSG